MDKYVISLGKKPGEFDLIIEGSIKDLNRIDEGGWPRKQKDKVRIRKRANGKLVSDVFTGVPAAALLFSIKIAKKEGKDFYISASTTNWPSGKVLKDEPSKKIAAFLEEYAPLFHRDPGIGTKWLGSTEATPYVEYETQDTEPDTEDLIKEEIKFSPSDPSQNAAHTPDDDRPVTPRKLWEAGRRTYLQSKAGGGRFRLLDIEEQIMPFYSKDDKRAHSKGIDLPIQVRIGNSKDESPLAKAIETTQGNLYLIGEGGIGKTTALFRIMEQHYKESPYDPNGEIPLFVALNRAPISFERWYNDPNGFESRFIRMEIGRQLLGCDELWEVPEEYVQYITKELKESPADGKPRYLLLLDGLNEVSVDYVKDTNRSHQINGKEPTEQVRQLIIGEIWKLFNEYPNVRIILTSRTDEINFIHTSHPTEKLYLTGLKEKHIRGYLEKKKFTKTQIDAAIANERLLECLVIPLFLTMYADLRDVSNVSSRGEILSKFFHERGGNIAYAQQDVIEKLKSDTCHLWFILDFLLPAIGHEMEKKGVFEIRAKEIAAIINPILKGMKPTSNGHAPLNAAEEPYDASAIGEYGKECFDKYRTYGKTVKTIAKEILDKSDVTEYVVNCSLDILKILYNSNGKYCFIHHHFRDYFAAVHDINMLRIAVCAFEDEPELAFESLAPFRANPNHREKSIFIGEILGERHNAPVQVDGKWKYNVPDKPCDRNLIKRALDIFRGRFGDEVGYGVYNLIESMKVVRDNLSGENLSKLNLTFIGFNGVNFVEYLNGTSLKNAKLGHNNLFPVGHSGRVYSAAFNQDDTRIVTASADNTAKVWDTETGTRMLDLIGHDRSVLFAAFNQDGTRIVTASADNAAKIWDAETGTLLHDLIGHNGSIHNAEYNCDGTCIVTSSDDGTAIIWDAESGTLLHSLIGHLDCVYTAMYSQDGTRIVTASNDGTAKVWNALSGELLLDLKGHNGGVLFAKYNLEGDRIVTSSIDGTDKVWEASTGETLFDLKGGWGAIRFAMFSHDGSRIVTVDLDRMVYVWDATTGALLYKLIGHRERVYSAVYNNDDTRIVTGSHDGTVKIWDAITGTLLYNIKRSNGNSYSTVFNHDGTRIVVGCGDGTIKILNTTTGMLLNEMKGQSNSVNSAVYSPDGTRIITASADGTAKEWDADTGVLLFETKGHSDSVRSALFNHDGTRIVTSSLDGTAKVWDENTGTMLYKLTGISEYNAALYSPDGAHIIAVSNEWSVKVWNAETGVLQHDIKGHSAGINSAEYSPDGTQIVTASWDDTARIWDSSSGEQLHELQGHTDIVNSAKYNFDGSRIVTASVDGTAKVWDAETGALLLDMKGHSSGVKSAMYNQDDTRIVTASWDGTAKVWDAATGTLLHDLKGHSDSVGSAVFNRSNTRIVTASYDGTVKVWDASTGALLLDMKGHSSGVKSAMYNQDGTRIVTASWDGTAKVWDAETGECLDTIPNIPGLMVKGADIRNLHPDSNISDEDKAILRRYGAIVD